MIEARGSPAAIARAYTFFSRLYSRTVMPLEREAARRALTRARLEPGKRLLEVAVGTGVVFERLQQRAGRDAQLVGLDLSPGMLAATRQRVPSARLVRADARALPFASDHFDLVWSSYLLDLIPTADLTPLLGEFRRVLKPGGRLLLLNFSKNGAQLTRWERLYRLAPGWLVPYLFGACRPVQAEPFARAAGFDQVERTFVADGLPSEIIVGWKLR